MTPAKTTIHFSTASAALLQEIEKQHQSAPPPAPAPSPVPAPTREASLYIIEEYQLFTISGDLGVKHDPIGTLSIPGNSKKTAFVKTSRIQTNQSNISTTILESQEEAITQNICRFG